MNNLKRKHIHLLKQQLKSILCAYVIESDNRVFQMLFVQFDHSARTQAKYQLKYDACTEALALIDEVFLISSRIQINEMCTKLMAAPPQYKSVTELSASARKCHNNLALTCDNPETIELFLLLIGMRPGQDFSADKIVDFRAAIRRELRFAGEIVDKNRERAWVATIYPEPWTMNDGESLNKLTSHI